MSQLKNLMNACPPPRVELNVKMKLCDGEIHIDTPEYRRKKSNGVSSRQYEASENSLKILINDEF